MFPPALLTHVDEGIYLGILSLLRIIFLTRVESNVNNFSKSVSKYIIYIVTCGKKNVNI